MPNSEKRLLLGHIVRSCLTPNWAIIWWGCIKIEAHVPHGGIIQRRAYILRSLKHPDEAETLRQVYGSSFFLIAAYAPHNSRRNNLARGIAQTRNEYPVERHYAAAEALMNRDQEELGMPHGQNLRDTFHRADAFVDTTDPATLRGSIGRVVELIFGNTFHTPTKAEYFSLCV